MRAPGRDLRLSIVALFVFLGACASSPPPAAREAVRHDVTADDGHKLALWEKRPAMARGVILLLHGRTWSGLPNFDLQVPGEKRSLMDAFVARGYAAYALDSRGYGATPRDATGWLTPDRAVTDVATVLDWLRQREKTAPVLLGLSKGAAVSILAAQRHPDKLPAVILLGFAMDIDAEQPTTPPDAVPAKKTNTKENAASDFITPGATTKATLDTFVATALKDDPVRVDWRDEDQFNAFDPAAVKVPVLLIHGVHDPYATVQKGERLFTRLGTGDRSWVIIPNSDHAVHLEDGQARLVQAVIDFVERR